jgi:hypothetical protein
MDITGYLFMICKDIFSHARYSFLYPFISFVSSSFFIDVLHFILTYPSFYPHISSFILLFYPFYPTILSLLSCYFIPFILLFYPFYPAILSLLSCYLSCWLFDPVLGPGLIRIVTAPA